MTAASPQPGRVRRALKVLLLVLVAIAAMPVMVAMLLGGMNEGRR